MAIASFKRIEKKYLITIAQRDELKKVLEENMVLDPFCLDGRMYRIENIYFDTYGNSVIRESLEKPLYKEKLRMRKYEGKDQYFLEIKKKYNHVVGKRRIKMSEEEAFEFLKTKALPEKHKYVPTHIVKEIEYYLKYNDVYPATVVKYDRYAYFGKEDKSFRVTFDINLKSRKSNFVFGSDDFDRNIIPEDMCILEIKTSYNYPLWLVRALDRIKIYPHSFSKYGYDYKERVKENKGVLLDE